MIKALTSILLCQLVGEVIAGMAGLRVPGAVIGLILLFGLLHIGGETSKGLMKAGDMLLSNLSLLFVPAGVGVMAHWTLLMHDGMALSVAIVFSTLITIGVTGATMASFQRARTGKQDAAHD
ncbi:CidA/LrgA family protein [Novosphingobium humi]|uniref:CidA/LrgA family protein n=1 Tax=Novosphingobium humi TaxID=2282397 RepID=A0ABY7U2N6_9SPHN|nr:CidA/LrgA family protein [Novosphingobium humi]WCT79152.1 CidA/LrgA family protein [Novosphingobium humi]